MTTAAVVASLTHLSTGVLQVKLQSHLPITDGARESVTAHGLHRPTRERHRALSPVYGGTSGLRTGRRCDPHLASSESERGYTEFPERGESPPIQFGADGSSHRQRASHAIAPDRARHSGKGSMSRPMWQAGSMGKSSHARNF